MSLRQEAAADVAGVEVEAEDPLLGYGIQIYLF